MMPTAAGAQLEPAESDLLPAGAKAGRWVIEGELGRGGMGAVYAVHHEGIGKRAALKVMHRRLLTDASIERILLEARVVNQVGHPNIVDIFETGTLDDGRPYILMERLDGVPLSSHALDGKLLPDRVIGILLQICDALIAAHAAGIVHRDLKLDNVFLLDNPEDPGTPRVKLLDWGIAKVISQDPRTTLEGQLVGTPQYLAPEQARGAAVSPRTDVYSLGVMAYELFLEQLPFEAETSAEVMAMHLRAQPPPPGELWPDIPPALEHLLLAMLAKDPDDRPSMLMVAHTLELVRAELERRRAHGGPVPEPPRPSRYHVAVPGEGSRRWQFAVGTLALAASTAMFILTRDGDGSAATRRRPFVLPTANVAPAPIAAPAPLPVTPLAPEPVPPRVIDAPARHRPAVATGHHGSKSHHVTRKVTAAPRRSAPRDPDGTVDPYR